MKLLAVEGNPQPKHGLTWGAAAVEIGGTIFNAVTWRECPPLSFRTLVENGTLVKLAKPAPIAWEPRDKNEGLCVVVADTNRPTLESVRDILRPMSVGHVITGGKEFLAFSYTRQGPDCLKVAARQLCVTALAMSDRNEASLLAHHAVTLDSSLRLELLVLLKHGR